MVDASGSKPDDREVMEVRLLSLALVEFSQQRKGAVMSTRTLVLDPGFQPHRIVEWTRAVALLFQSKAEVIDSYDEPLMTEEQADTAQANGWTLVMKVPAVIRLFKAATRKKAVKFSRANVLARDRMRCQYCGLKTSADKLNYDHVVPRAQGGKTVWENIVSSCYPCNARKSDRTPAQAGMRLRTRPIKPKSLPIMMVHIDRNASIPDQWRNFFYWHGELESD
jgi:5-methylcytosine-specific restriction endonuclease McrA